MIVEGRMMSTLQVVMRPCRQFVLAAGALSVSRYPGWGGGGWGHTGMNSNMTVDVALVTLIPNTCL